MSFGRIIESPVFKEKFYTADNTPLVDVYCPIDGTQLVAISEYDFSNYSCLACKATYDWGEKNQDSLRKRAAEYVKELKHRAEEKNKELKLLEKIIKAAQYNGF